MPRFICRVVSIFILRKLFYEKQTKVHFIIVLELYNMYYKIHR